MNGSAVIYMPPRAGRAGATGEVILVGGGPGDPELLTIKALKALQTADVVLYDNLVAPEIVDMARPETERVYVGKRCGSHALPQEEINALLVRFARSGKRVVRLKGGDPFIFGRGGEELEHLARNGIPFQVVPGVTAAAGVGAYAGIPLTHRDYAQSLVLVTGHRKDDSLDLDWEALARPRQTLVIYMGLGTLPALCGKLIEHGLPASTPAAIVEKATTADQKVMVGTLATLPALAVTAGIKPPTLIVVGEVVALQEKLAWFRPGCDADPESATTAVAQALPA
jgi:uroporphyrin-III C-methyltransferase / precorrin-2 dehydrogenase / sirohydrochlorin ferrochelatase